MSLTRKKKDKFKKGDFNKIRNLVKKAMESKVKKTNALDLARMFAI